MALLYCILNCTQESNEVQSCRARTFQSGIFNCKRVDVYFSAYVVFCLAYQADEFMEMG